MKKLTAIILTMVAMVGTVSTVNADTVENNGTWVRVNLTDKCSISTGSRNHSINQWYDEINGTKVLVRQHLMSGKEVYMEYIVVQE